MNTFLNNPDGTRLAYSKTEGKNPGIVFLGGFRSDMTGSKATYLADCAQQWGNAFVRFDYFGHGASDGKFIDGTLGRWLKDALRVIDELTTGPQVLVGSSMGGWLMLLVALARPDRVKGLVGIAAAPDFLDDFKQVTQEQRESLEKTGICYVPSGMEGEPYPITQALLSDAKQYNLLHQQIAIDCPVRLLQGMNDAEVTWQKAMKISEQLRSTDVQVTLIKQGDHRLSSNVQLSLLATTVKALT